MARQAYKEDQSIHSMNARQLRQYIADQAQEAQARLDSAPETPSKAFEELKGVITYKNGKVRKSTSYETVAEMREHAYALRSFNKFDEESAFAAKTDYQKNRKRYESFVKNQIAKSGTENQYWAQFLTKKGNVSKRGYQAYKDFIAVLKASDEMLKSFGYRDIQQYAQDKRSNLDPDNKILNRIISKVYAEGKGQGLTQSELLKNLKREYDEALNKEASKQKPKTTRAKVPSVKKTKKTKSKSNIKVKTGKKMKSGAVREKLS